MNWSQILILIFSILFKIVVCLHCCESNRWNWTVLDFSEEKKSLNKQKSWTKNNIYSEPLLDISGAQELFSPACPVISKCWFATHYSQKLYALHKNSDSGFFSESMLSAISFIRQLRQFPRKNVLELCMLSCSLCFPLCFTSEMKHALPTSGSKSAFIFDSLSFSMLGSATWSLTLRTAG